MYIYFSSYLQMTFNGFTWKRTAGAFMLMYWTGAEVTKVRVAPRATKKPKGTLFVFFSQNDLKMKLIIYLAIICGICNASPKSIPVYKLLNGDEIPSLGLGTHKVNNFCYIIITVNYCYNNFMLNIDRPKTSWNDCYVCSRTWCKTYQHCLLFRNWKICWGSFKKMVCER